MTVPDAIEVLVGEATSETRLGAVTVRVALPVTPETVAAMATEPGILLVTMPARETVAMLRFDELQLADCVRSLLLPSLYLPVAVNC